MIQALLQKTSLKQAGKKWQNSLLLFYQRAVYSANILELIFNGQALISDMKKFSNKYRLS